MGAGQYSRTLIFATLKVASIKKIIFLDLGAPVGISVG
jgi:hypothetical protein